MPRLDLQKLDASQTSERLELSVVLSGVVFPVQKRKQ